MKKNFISILICLFVVLAITLTACGNQDSGVYPNPENMKVNLEQKGYTVFVLTDLGDKEGTYLSAKKDDEFIEIYWFENFEDGDYLYNKVKNDYPNYTALALLVNETNDGLIYCGTVAAVKDAGIKTIVTKVNVKV